jgi:hypothetical protein
MAFASRGRAKSARTGAACYRNNAMGTPAGKDPGTVADIDIARRADAGPDRGRAKAGDHHIGLVHAAGRWEVPANYTARSRSEPLRRRHHKGSAFSARAESH